MARDQSPANHFVQFAHQMAGQLVRARVVERIRVVDANENHGATFPRLDQSGLVDERKQTAALSNPARAPQAANDRNTPAQNG